jgi:hypothetical protein
MVWFPRTGKSGNLGRPVTCVGHLNVVEMMVCCEPRPCGLEDLTIAMVARWMIKDL